MARKEARRTLTLDILIAQVAAVRSKGNKGKRPRFNKVNTPKVIKRVPGPADDTLMIQAHCDALTDETRDKYEVIIVFHDLRYSETQSSGYPIPAKITRNLTLYIQQPSRKDTPVSVTCTCADYYYTWWWYNRHGKEDVHAFVDFPPYVRKTTTYPERNPGKVQGVCKHIRELGKVLVSERTSRS